jgi:dTDP-4-dehydrorhamnose 3,5-epimerase
MKVTETRIPGVLLIEPKVFGDHRGFFMESWQQQRYREAGVPVGMVQDNLSSSGRGVLRGLHVQHPHAQGKLVQVIQGEVFDVAVDIRRGSPWFGQWVGVHLDGASQRQFYVPPGFAHGFLVLSESALFSYKCTDYYAPENEFSVLWNDPRIGIDWPLTGTPSLSAKDLQAQPLEAIDPERLPPYQE